MDLLSTLSATGEFATPLVDTHHHLWDLKTGHYRTKQDRYDKNFFVAVMREALAKETPETIAKFFARNAIRFYRIPIQLP